MANGKRDTSANYVVTDPQARGPEAVARSLENQVAYCRDNGAPITASVCEALRSLLDTDRGGIVMERVRKWAGPALADALPLRVAGGLHALHLSGAEPELRPIYEGHEPTDTQDRIAAALEKHEAFLLPWLDGPPQTNEAGRSWAFAAAMLWLADEGLPNRFELIEIGSSAGINLMMRRYRFDLGGVTAGPEGASMQLTPEWRGNPPPNGSFEIVGARGCDVAPVDLTDPDQALRLRAYIWPEFTTRFARMDAAIEAAETMPPDITRSGAGDFLTDVLAEDQEDGVTRIVMHSVVWQYIPAHERDRINTLMETSGAAATDEAPLAWVSLEANRDTHRHELSVRYWPGGEEWTKLGTAHPHGEWVEWGL
ncbi:DUF2332 domain-containing protein [Erythrobacter sp. HKB08]|uniref:DUF2332 domain-containing protein n=1 Tax=Erythrobacter sp. HKB08 TaxID=2502843 RepID=UPI0010092520|nr:DUF2332 domain-containing protein [Erythrobacter sp. HKB08]